MAAANDDDDEEDEDEEEEEEVLARAAERAGRQAAGACADARHTRTPTPAGCATTSDIALRRRDAKEGALLGMFG